MSLAPPYRLMGIIPLPERGSGSSSWVYCVVIFLDQLLHLVDVPNHFCFGTKRAGVPENRWVSPRKMAIIGGAVFASLYRILICKTAWHSLAVAYAVPLQLPMSSITYYAFILAPNWGLAEPKSNQ